MAYLNNFKISTGLRKVSFSFCDSMNIFLLHFLINCRAAKGSVTVKWKVKENVRGL